MRKELDRWRLVVPGEPSQGALARFLIGMEELRIRLNPEAYPNLELSDEGYLWFNVVSPPGNWEVLALLFGFGVLPGPALALSFPHRPQDLGSAFRVALGRAVPAGSNGIIFAAFSSREEVLTAYARDLLPPLHLVVGEDEVRSACEQVEFLSYCGLYLPAAALTVEDAERSIRQVLAMFEGRSSPVVGQEIVTTPEGPVGTDPIEHRRREEQALAGWIAPQLLQHPERRFPVHPLPVGWPLLLLSPQRDPRQLPQAVHRQRGDRRRLRPPPVHRAWL